MSRDLPPGVSVNDLPGNRPEDVAEDAFWDELENQLNASKVKIPYELYDVDWFVEAIRIARDMGYNLGYADAVKEQEMTVLGKCPHGVDLDEEFCPEGCRV